MAHTEAPTACDMSSHLGALCSLVGTRVQFHIWRVLRDVKWRCRLPTRGCCTASLQADVYHDADKEAWIFCPDLRQDGLVQAGVLCRNSLVILCLWPIFEADILLEPMFWQLAVAICVLRLRPQLDQAWLSIIMKRMTNPAASMDFCRCSLMW